MCNIPKNILQKLPITCFILILSDIFITENAYHSFTKPLFHKTYLTGSMMANYVTHLHTKMSKSSQMSILLFEMLQLYNVSLQSASKPESKTDPLAQFSNNFPSLHF